MEECKASFMVETMCCREVRALNYDVLSDLNVKQSLLGLLLFWMKLGIKYVYAISEVYSLLEIMGVTSPYLDVFTIAACFQSLHTKLSQTSCSRIFQGIHD
ncbi:hypothetical protein H5410_041589 [Solanum commersonii]|uniref:Uncharacterized protein n=1 Tax=Solanum commersonii TaxID=4109 RepID=A0A9J5XS00_SOLCO|nr:hypothetical protein H5410_041589 [Solanum commersonii]